MDIFVDFMSKFKSLLDYTNLFSRNEYDKNDKNIFSKYRDEKIILLYLW